MIQTPIDAVIIVTLVCVIGGLAAAFVRARRPELWRRLWLAWALLFVVIEFLGALNANTLSENIVASVPLPILIGVTIALAAILSIHWWDLARRIHGR
jgi:uncharacterized membrane protein YfcA